MKDDDGTLRFKSNRIVETLLRVGQQHGCDMNTIALADFSNDDRQQFAQLIGYSLSGYGELSYVDDHAYNTAELMSDGMAEDAARIANLTAELAELRKALRKPMANLFGVHPDDLKRNG